MQLPAVESGQCAGDPVAIPKAGDRAHAGPWWNDAPCQQHPGDSPDANLHHPALRRTPLHRAVRSGAERRAAQDIPILENEPVAGPGGREFFDRPPGRKLDGPDRFQRQRDFTGEGCPDRDASFLDLHGGRVELSAPRETDPGASHLPRRCRVRATQADE